MSDVTQLLDRIEKGPTNCDGVAPQAGLTLSVDVLYGTTVLGGSSGEGTAYTIGTNGTGFTNLHSFSFPPSSYDIFTALYCGLFLSGKLLYGTMYYGGSYAS